MGRCRKEPSCYYNPTTDSGCPKIRQKLHHVYYALAYRTLSKSKENLR